MVKEKNKTIEFIERLEKGEELQCPLCKKGVWRMTISHNGKTHIFKCDNCGKAIAPKTITV